MSKILIVYYSLQGTTAELAQQISLGVKEIPGAESMVRTVPKVSTVTSTSSPDIPPSGPPYATKEELSDCDALIIGSPTRFGNMAAPMKYFLDGTSDLWLSGALAGKPAAVFSSTATMHGGQETTLISMMLPLLHHGMLIVGLPYSEAGLFSTMGGGTPYGPTHVSGPQHDQPFKEEEKQLARALGRRVATIAEQLQKNKTK